MAEFKYSSKDPQGNLAQGIIEAPNEDQAVLALHQKGFIILSLTETSGEVLKKDISSVFSLPSKKDVVIFTRQLATLIDADVALVDGLHILATQTSKVSFKKIILAVANDIEGGATLSIALADHKKVFSEFYVSLVRAGEVSGKLQATLLYLADYLERSAALSTKIKGALAYPVFVLCALVLIAIIMVTTVLPQLLTIIKDAGVTDIPLTTQILIGFTTFFNAHIVALGVVFIGAIFAVIYFAKTPQGKATFDELIIRAPQIGGVARNFYLARMAETLSTLIKSGVPILDGLTITSQVVGNETYRAILIEARTNVQGGGTMSEVFADYKEVIPVLVSSMLAIGEKTGRTDAMLDNIFQFYKTEAENNIQNLSQLIEPILILILGVGVGLLVSAVLLPIYSLVGAN